MISYTINSFNRIKKSNLLSQCSGLLVFLLLLSGPNDLFAAVNTHLWQESHRGYSLEEIPDTVGGGPVEYVAAGTMYTNGPGSRAGWHFMRLDDNGVILDSRIAYCSNTDDEFRVVDITVESATKFWITISARHMVSGSQYDYIYVVGVDQHGNDLGLNPAIHITPTAAVSNYRNLYPTHSLYLGSALYICGYAAENTQVSNHPDYYSDKLGMFIKCDVNSTPVTTNYYFWDSDNSQFPIGDFDMALRISPSLSASGFLPDFPLLVTGSANGYGTGYLSSVLAMKFNSAGNPMLANAYLPTAYSFSPDPIRAHGVYGVDMRGAVPAEDQELEGGGYVILVNRFDHNEPSNRSWGILRVKENLTVYDPTTNYSYVGLNDMKSWASQFLIMSYTDKSKNSSIEILGEQNDLYGGEQPGCDTVFSPNLPPSHYPNNINPFYTTLGVSGVGLWDYTNGFGPTYNSVFHGNHTVHLSANGTAANNMVYLYGSQPNGYLEDITRLYTFGASTLYYYGWSSGVPNPPSMLVPIGELNNPSMPYLNTKFIKMTGSSGEETVCNNYIYDCPELFTSTTYPANPVFASIFYDGLQTDDAYNYFSLTEDYYLPLEMDCGTGYYKPTDVADLGGASNEVSFYPNPASSELNISIGKNISKNDKCQFLLLSSTGQQVISTSVFTNKQEIKVNLSELPAGLYMGILTINDKKYTEKISIQ